MGRVRVRDQPRRGPLRVTDPVWTTFFEASQVLHPLLPDRYCPRHQCPSRRLDPPQILGADGSHGGLLRHTIGRILRGEAQKGETQLQGGLEIEDQGVRRGRIGSGGAGRRDLAHGLLRPHQREGSGIVREAHQDGKSPRGFGGRAPTGLRSSLHPVPLRCCVHCPGGPRPRGAVPCQRFLLLPARVRCCRLLLQSQDGPADFAHRSHWKRPGGCGAGEGQRVGDGGVVGLPAQFWRLG
mmetsp:Transcript_4592/g.9696  ORF Transcript_4592/g.9696 Transcript_4592/m.9696 type:complete len:239 (-) Transcript_4592:178-894(-)